jgi:tetratricopeptide (TPR) repeat protein/acyl carrier protein
MVKFLDVNSPCGIQMFETENAPTESQCSETLKDDLLATFRQALGQPNFGPEEGFLASGGDSLTVIETILEIEKQHGVTLSAAEFMALDTAEHVAQRIETLIRERHADTESGFDPKQTTMFSVVQEGGPAHPLICTYSLHGEAAHAITLSGLLPADQAVAALQIRTQEPLDQDGRSFREKEKISATSIFNHYARRRPVLLGYSLGAHVALAIGHELTQLGAPPAVIVVLDDEADLDRREFGALQRVPKPASVTKNLSHTLRCSPAEPIAAGLVYFRSTENDAYYRSDPTSGWGEIATGGVKIFDINANHLEFVRERGLRQIAPKLQEEIVLPSQGALTLPSEVELLRFKARCAAREGHLPNEIARLRRVIDHDHEQPAWLYTNLAEALFQNGDTTLALDALTKARNQEKWQLTLDLRFLDEFKRRGMETEQHDIFRRLQTVVSDHPSVHEQKAQAYFKLGLWSECRAELNAGFAMMPKHFRLSQLLVKYLVQTKAWSELVETTQRLVEYFPYSRPFRTALIQAYAEIGTPEKALHFHGAITAETRPDFQGLVALSSAFMLCGQSANALELAERAAEAEPRRPKAHRLRAKCLKSLGRTEEAAAAMQMANQLRSNSAAKGNM